MFFYLEIVIIIKEINYEKTTGTYIFLFKNSYNKKTSIVTSVTELNILNGKYILFLLKFYNIELFDGFKLLMSKVNM